MSAAALSPDAAVSAPRKGGKMPLLLGLALAILGAGGGFYAAWAGYVGGAAAEAADAHAAAADPAGHDSGDGHGAPAAVAFVPLDPVLVNLPGGSGRVLRFAAQVEVDPSHLEEVTALTPRIVDVLNGYLRAVEVAEIETPSALLGLRAQMLRRVQVVAGPGRVRDLLVMEFVVN